MGSRAMRRSPCTSQPGPTGPTTRADSPMAIGNTRITSSPKAINPSAGPNSRAKSTSNSRPPRLRVSTVPRLEICHQRKAMTASANRSR